MFTPDLLFNISYGLYIITAREGNENGGFVSNTVMQITSSPVQIATMVSKNNRTCAMMEKSGAFNISVLSEDVRKSVIGTFGYKSGSEIDKFADVAYATDAGNIPYITEGCLAYLSCKVVRTIDFDTHIMFVAEVVDGGELSDGKALTYAEYRVKFKGASPKNAPTFQQPLNQTKMEKELYVCDLCGYTYDPEVGDPDNGIAPGTAFADLPSNWTCPICGVDKSSFSKK